MTLAPAWSPVLEGTDADRAHEAIDAIARDLAERRPPTEVLDSIDVDNLVGRSLFFSYLHEIGGAREHAEFAEAFAADAVDAGSRLVSWQHALFGGTVGTAWLLRHLRRYGFAITGDATEEFDEGLLDFVAEATSHDFDLVAGLSGVGTYLLEGAVGQRERAILGAITRRLVETAQSREPGLSWLARPALHQLAGTEGTDNLGLAHGTPGVIGFLSALSERCRDIEIAGPLLRETVKWLLAQERSEHAYRRYSYHGRAPEVRARLGWCYGDPGVAVSLWLAARATSDDEWRARARALARAAAACPWDRSGVVDAAICHGATGLAHIFRCLGLASGDAHLTDAARRWYRQALALRTPGEGVGGYRFMTKGGRDGSFLTGAAGVGLVLLAGVSWVDPAWDLPLLTRFLRSSSC